MAVELKGSPIKVSPGNPLSFSSESVASAAVPAMMEGQNIVCFAKDWSEDATCCNHVLKELAKQNKILWVNSISTRTPNLGSGRDLRKIANKLAGFFKGAKRVDERMWVYTPVVLPLHHRKWAVALNRMILRTALSLLRRRLRMKSFQLWTFVPTAAEYAGTLGEDLTVYYCTDEWSLFSFVSDPAAMIAMEKRLCERCDVVFGTARTLTDRKRPFNPETHAAPHGVDYQLFSRAVEADATIPADFAHLRAPVLGFYGTIEDWVDQDLIAYLAERRPEWTIVLLGKVCVDVSRLEKYPNVHFLGRRPHSELPNYCKGFSVGLIPYRVTDERMRYVNPVKLREYLSAGLPVVATDAVPEVRSYEQFCHIAPTYEEFETAVEAALHSDSPQERRRRSAAMAGETWHRKVGEISSHILRVQEKKRQRNQEQHRSA